MTRAGGDDAMDVAVREIDWSDMRRYFPWLEKAEAEARDAAAEIAAEEVEAACRAKQLEAAADVPFVIFVFIREDGMHLHQ